MIDSLLRKLVKEEAKNCCEYCRNQNRFSTGLFSVEHIIPLSKGGLDVRENLAYACPACNAHKFTKTHALDITTRQVVPLFNPRTQIWEQHFSWNDDFTIVIGLTPVGRATVQALNMNREESVNLRRVLFAFGEHPPL